MKDWIAAILIGIIGAALILMFLGSWLATGPDCPGMDPAWLGWCE